MTNLKREVTAYVPFGVPTGVLLTHTGNNNWRALAKGTTDEEVVQLLVNFHDAIGAEVFRLRRLVNTQKAQEILAVHEPSLPKCTCEKYGADLYDLHNDKGNKPCGLPDCLYREG